MLTIRLEEAKAKGKLFVEVWRGKPDEGELFSTAVGESIPDFANGKVLVLCFPHINLIVHDDGEEISQP